MVTPHSWINSFKKGDASIVGLGCVLIEHGKVIAYVSRQFKAHEKKYSTHDPKLADLVFYFKICRHYVYGSI